jgi:Domain of unknown function (DUF4118)
MRQADLESLTAVFDVALAGLRRRIPPGSVQAYAFAFACTFVATLFEEGLLWLDPMGPRLSGYYPAVALTALLVGIVPGALVAVAGVLIAWWGFMAPAYSFSLSDVGTPSRWSRLPFFPFSSSVPPTISAVWRSGSKTKNISVSSPCGSWLIA